MSKPQPFTSNAIKRRRLDHRITVGAGVGVTLIIGNTEQDVRARISRQRVGTEYAEDCYRNESESWFVHDDLCKGTDSTGKVLCLAATAMKAAARCGNSGSLPLDGRGLGWGWQDRID